MKHAPPMTNAAFKLRETYEKYGLVPAPPAFVTHKPTRTYTHKHTHTPTRISIHKHARTHTVYMSSGPTCACAYARLGCGPCVHFAYARVGVGCCQCSQHPVWGACQAAPALRRHARPAGSLGQRHPRRGASQTQRERRGTERQRRTFVHRHVHTCARTRVTRADADGCGWGGGGGGVGWGGGGGGSCRTASVIRASLSRARRHAAAIVQMPPLAPPARPPPAPLPEVRVVTRIVRACMHPVWPWA
jgi:hypothetical protein